MSWWPFGEEKEKPSLLIYYPHKEEMKIWSATHKFAKPTVVTKFDALLGGSPPYAILLYRPDFGMEQGKIAARIAQIKDRFPSVPVIAYDIHHMCDIYMQAGIDYYLDCEWGYFDSTIAKDVQFGFGRGFSTFSPNALRKTLDALAVKHPLTQTSKGMAEEKRAFYNSAATVFDQRAAVTADTHKELDFLIMQLQKNHCVRVLDCGCGNGRLSIPLAKAGFSVNGIDISDELIAQAQQRATGMQNCAFSRQNALELKQEYAYDAVLLMWHALCEFKNHQPELLKILQRALKIEGVLIFDVPDRSGNRNIDSQGVYSHDSPVGKYIGSVPELKQLFFMLEVQTGYTRIEYFKVNWGVPKYVFIALKHGLWWSSDQLVQRNR